MYILIPHSSLSVDTNDLHSQSYYLSRIYGVCVLWVCVCRGSLNAIGRVRAYLDASYHGFVHRQVPIVGPISERWLVEE